MVENIIEMWIDNEKIGFSINSPFTLKKSFMNELYKQHGHLLALPYMIWTHFSFSSKLAIIVNHGCIKT